MSDNLTTAYMLGVEDMRSKLHKAADEIERLRAENEKLRAALKPFAELSVAVEGQYENCLPSEKHLAGVGYGHLRAAAAAIRESGDE